LAALLLVPLDLIAAQSPAGAFGTWVAEAPPAGLEGVNLRAVDCVGTSTCVAVGAGGTIIQTDGGGTWSNKTTAATNKDLFGVSCTATDDCVAVGRAGAVLRLQNGTWRSRPSGTTSNLYAVNCTFIVPRVPVQSFCIAVGDRVPLGEFILDGVVTEQGPATILSSTDSGNTWSPELALTGRPLAAVDCPTALTCVATGYGNVFLRTHDGGTTWTRGQRVSPDGVPVAWDILGVSCPTSATCAAVDSAGFLLQSSTGGAAWTEGGSTATSMAAVDCAATVGGSRVIPCFAVGYGGKIQATGPLGIAGMAWTDQSSAGMTNDLLGVSCTDVTCRAVGDSGTILKS